MPRYQREANESLCPRNRRMGLNIIFVSKQCLNEARPILLSTATFNVNMSYMYIGRRGRSNSQTWPKTIQGFSEAELTLVRKLELPCQPPWNTSKAIDDCVYNRISSMPSLHSVMIVTAFWQAEYLEAYIKDVTKKTVLRYITQNGYFQQLDKVAEHIQQAPQRTRHAAQFLLKFHINLPTTMTKTASGPSIGQLGGGVGLEGWPSSSHREDRERNGCWVERGFRVHSLKSCCALRSHGTLGSHENRCKSHAQHWHGWWCLRSVRDHAGTAWLA